MRFLKITQIQENQKENECKKKVNSETITLGR